MRVLTPFIVSTCMLIVPFAFGVESQLTKKIEQQTQLKIQYHGNAILRFENETFKQRNHRQRLRLVGRAGVNFQYGGFQFNSRLSTGNKNKQNIPAITVAKFNEQPDPPTDIFLERFFVTYKTTDLSVSLGKQPWMFSNQTDTFWDRQLHPQGLFVQYKLSPSSHSRMAILKPLDGATDTVGSLSVVQYVKQLKLGQGKFTFAPWWVSYEGDSATFAIRDTQYDHESLRLSSSFSDGMWKTGIDIGYAFNSPELIVGNPENISLAFQVNYGKLKQIGDYQAHLRFFYTERFSVISEFAQNATAGFATSNIKGFDTRFRYKLSNAVWVGARLSRLHTITTDAEQSTRFRIEAMATF